MAEAWTGPGRYDSLGSGDVMRSPSSVERWRLAASRSVGDAHPSLRVPRAISKIRRLLKGAEDRMFWDGTRWVDERALSRVATRQRRRGSDWIATLAMLVGALTLVIP